MQQYHAFGLSWAMPFHCPELGTPIPNKSALVDVAVCLGDVPTTLPASAKAGPFQQVTPEAVLFHFPKVASFLVKGGQSITIAPEENASETQIRTFLLGTAASLLLHQRGLLPLHASGIRTAKGAVLFAGHSGFGKSTLLATFSARGYEMLTDDLATIVLDEAERPFVYPSYPHLKLWADSAEKLNKSTENLNRIRPDFAKFSVPSQVPFNKKQIPLYAVYALSPHNEPGIRLEPLHSARKFNVFLDHTWQKLALKKMGRHVAHFKQAVAIANHAKIARVYRPDEPFQPQALADQLEADFLS